jgi:zinc transporter ZupT
MQESVSVALIPAIVMLSCSIFGISRQNPPSKKIGHAIQHFAAGILLSAIALELIPPIAAAKGFANTVAITTGFSLGSIVMTALPFVLGERSREQSAHPHGKRRRSESDLSEAPTVVDERTTPASSEDRAESRGATPLGTALVDAPKRSYSLPSHPSRAFFTRRESSAIYSFDDGIQARTTGRFPTVLAAAVYIDSFMDGLLVGISLLSGDRRAACACPALAAPCSVCGVRGGKLHWCVCGWNWG